MKVGAVKAPTYCRLCTAYRLNTPKRNKPARAFPICRGYIEPSLSVSNSYALMSTFTACEITDTTTAVGTEKSDEASQEQQEGEASMLGNNFKTARQGRGVSLSRTLRGHLLEAVDAYAAHRMKMVVPESEQRPVKREIARATPSSSGGASKVASQCFRAYQRLVFDGRVRIRLCHRSRHVERDNSNGRGYIAGTAG